MTPDYLRVFWLREGWTWELVSQREELLDTARAYWPERAVALNEALAAHPDTALILQLEAE